MVSDFVVLEPFEILQLSLHQKMSMDLSLSGATYKYQWLRRSRTHTKPNRFVIRVPNYDNVGQSGAICHPLYYIFFSLGPAAFIIIGQRNFISHRHDEMDVSKLSKISSEHLTVYVTKIISKPKRKPPTQSTINKHRHMLILDNTISNVIAVRVMTSVANQVNDLYISCTLSSKSNTKHIYTKSLITYNTLLFKDNRRTL